MAGAPVRLADHSCTQPAGLASPVSVGRPTRGPVVCRSGQDLVVPRLGDVTSPYADLDRPPLPVPVLRSALAHDGGLWREMRVVAETGSTNADVAAAARAGAAEGLVVVAEHQSAGRGRLDRSWSSPARAGLTFSVLLRPAVPRDRWGLLGLVTAVAAAGALRRQLDVAIEVKWPNDLVVGDRKLAGLLAEVVDDAVVIGMGLNVSTNRGELRSGATSLAIETGQPTDRPPILLAVLRELATAYGGWLAIGGGPETVLPAYRKLSATLGRDVTAALPGGGTLTGRVVEIDGAGRLVVELPGGGEQRLAAGDVVHLRSSADPEGLIVEEGDRAVLGGGLEGPYDVAAGRQPYLGAPGPAFGGPDAGDEPALHQGRSGADLPADGALEDAFGAGDRQVRPDGGAGRRRQDPDGPEDLALRPAP